MRTVILSTMLAFAITAEIIDRVAVTVENSVITMSEIELQLRVTAMLDDKPLKLDEEALREGADRLIAQALVRREISIADYPAPPPDAAEKALQDLKQQRYGNDAIYRAALRKYGLTEDELRAQLLWQLTLLRFIEVRFRPAVQIPTEEVRTYYRETFTPDWQTRSNQPVPTLPRVREQIEAALIEERINSARDRWLNLTRSQLPIVYREEAFKRGVTP